MHEAPSLENRSVFRVLKASQMLGGLVVLLGVAGALLLWVKRDQQHIRARIEKNLGSIRAPGFPLSAQDMARLFPDPPAEQDAYSLLKPAFALLSVPDDPTNIPFFGGFDMSGNAPLDDATKEAGQKWMERNQPAFDAVPWVKMEGAWFGCGFVNGLTNLTLPRLSPMINLVRLLCLDAVLEAETQQPDKSIQALQRALVLGT